ncbi:response regulator [Aquabacterium sp.]|uniref:response regulator n=1 Tax=Aquabacterium sp. TaxID=1872578 RepID=UPI0025C2EF49|nr:response regulator [Aquabacterium sp.]
MTRVFDHLRQTLGTLLGRGHPRPAMRGAQTDPALRTHLALLTTLNQYAIVSATDRHGLITEANDAFCALSRYPREALIGQDHRILNSGHHPPGFWAEMWATVQSGQSWHGEVCNRASDGRLYWVNSVVIPVMDDHGQIDKLISVRTDITRLKTSEQQLRADEALLDRVGRLARVGGWQFELGIDRLTVTGQLSRLLDRPHAPRHHLDDVMMHLGQRARLRLQRAAVRAIEHGQTWDMELPAVTSEGRQIRLRSVGEAEREGDRVVRLVGTFQDITELHESRERLSHTRSLLSSVLDATTAFSVIATDLDLRVTLFNTGAERMLQYRAADVTGRQTPLFLHDATEVAQRCAELSAQHGRPFTAANVFTDPVVRGQPHEWTYLRRDGSRLRVSLVVTAMRSLSGEVIGYLGAAHDVTERLAHEATLRLATERAEKASQAKGQFLANMSHEIRTPMNAVLGMLKLLRRTPLARRQQDYTGKAERAARSLLALLNDILDFSKVEAGKMTLDPRPFQLEQLLRDLSVILSANLADKPVELAYDIDPRLPDTLVGDDLRLQQILINLGGNAIKFTRQGEIVLGMRLVRQSDKDVTVRVSVRDTGIGIAEEALQRIFDGFAQAEGHTSREFGGTGLGLSISQRLVRLMGGTLLVESVPGKGSTFYFDIPLSRVPEHPATLVQPDGEGKRVLLVDDNDVTRMLLMAQAEALGWQADGAESGPAALKMVDEAVQAGVPYDAVFVDWQMPGMDGWETSRHIRDSTPAPVTPLIVMVTAHDREALAERSEADPSLLDAYLIKPVTAMLLQRALSEHSPHRLTEERMPPPPPGDQRLPGLRVLLVEDNPNNQQVAQELLQDEGAEVQLACNGQEGVGAVLQASEPFDIVLMDIQMPVMDGLTAARLIQEALGDLAPPIVAMTANVAASDRDTSLAAGMVDHIGKPFDLDELVHVLCTHTDRTPQVVPPREATPPSATLLALAGTQGLELERALHRLGGRLDVYLRLLDNFSRDLQAAPGQIQAWFAEGDVVALQQWSHTVKGLAGTLGDPRLAAAIGQAHAEALRLGDRLLQPEAASAWALAVNEALTTAGQRLRPLQAQLAADLQRSPQASPPPPADTLTLLRTATRLLHLLDQSDMAATEVHKTLQATLGPEHRAVQTALQTAMDALDFGAATLHTRALMAQLQAETDHVPC